MPPRVWQCHRRRPTVGEPDADSDSGLEADLRDGLYEGSVTGTLSLPALALSESCSGSAILEVVTDTEDFQIVGALECWGSALGGVVISLEGNITTDPAAIGEVTIEDIETSTSWAGVFDGDNLSGSFGGTGIVD